jgi:hypothetical protein
MGKADMEISINQHQLSELISEEMSQRARHPVSVPDDAMKIKSKNIV